MRSIPILLLVFTIAGCPESRPPSSDGGTSSDAPPGAFCRELYGHQVNAGGRLGVARADWPCPETYAGDRALADQCIAFLQIEASSECEIETCEACP